MGKDVARKMKAMPYELKKLLRQYDTYNRKAGDVHHKITKKLEEYGVPFENITAEGDDYGDAPNNEGFTYIVHSEGNVEDNIEMIEEVFLYFVNRSKQGG